LAWADFPGPEKPVLGRHCKEHHWELDGEIMTCKASMEDMAKLLRLAFWVGV
jgi:hypothetical protein